MVREHFKIFEFVLRQTFSVGRSVCRCSHSKCWFNIWFGRSDYKSVNSREKCCPMFGNSTILVITKRTKCWKHLAKVKKMERIFSLLVFNKVNFLRLFYQKEPKYFTIQRFRHVSWYSTTLCGHSNGTSTRTEQFPNYVALNQNCKKKLLVTKRE